MIGILIDNEIPIINRKIKKERVWAWCLILSFTVFLLYYSPMSLNRLI